jgi:hypothetical protein
MEEDDSQLQELYAWTDAIPLSRRKKNVPRDFSDGVLMGEVVIHVFPPTKASREKRKCITGKH